MEKSIDIRIHEMREVYAELNKIGITEHTCLGISVFKGLVNDFIRGGGKVSGVIYIEELDRELEYNLENRENKPSVVLLRKKGIRCKK
jgi:hypothetical protein